MSGRVWFIAGAGRGLGRAFTEAALEAGDRVAATVRAPGALNEREGLRVLQLDVRDRSRVRDVVAEAVGCFGRPGSACDALRTDLFGTPDVPWPVAEPDPSEPAPSLAAAALLAHLGAPDGPLRLLVGDDAPGQVAVALDQRRRDYAKDARFTWPG